MAYDITRKNKEGNLMDAAQKISLQANLPVATLNNAYPTFEENMKGSIEPKGN